MGKVSPYILDSHRIRFGHGVKVPFSLFLSFAFSAEDEDGAEEINLNFCVFRVGECVRKCVFVHRSEDEKVKFDFLAFGDEHAYHHLYTFVSNYTTRR